MAHHGIARGCVDSISLSISSIRRNRNIAGYS